MIPLTISKILADTTKCFLPQMITRLISWLCYLSLMVFAQWELQSPLPTAMDIRGTAAPTTQHVFLATDNNIFNNTGALIESTDGGTTWFHRDIPINGEGLNGIFFYDANHGWVFGNTNYRTIDGGTTWTELPFLGSAYFLEFYTPDFGLITGNFGRYISRDGGLNWEPSPNDITAFDFANSQEGLGAAASGIYHTADGGVTFSLVHTGDARDVIYLSSTSALSIVDGNFYRSNDGGQTWTYVDTAFSRPHLQKVSANVVLAWGQSNSFPNFDRRVLRSGDGGQTWSDLGEIVPNGIRAFAVADTQTIIAADNEGNIYHSGNAGQDWSLTYNSPGPHPSFLGSTVPVFADAQTGYYGFGKGLIIKTTDGGLTWEQISSGTTSALKDIDRFPNNDLIAVGSDGVIVTKSATENQWVQHPPPSSNELTAVQVLNANEVVTVDNTGQVFMSQDGGNNWTPTPAKPDGLNPAKDIHFSTLQEGWVTGYGSSSGAVFHTKDGGTTWTPAPGFSGAYAAVDAEGTNVWVLNISGIYYYSNDGGATWAQGSLPGSSLQVQDIDFYDVSTGYAVGNSGKAFRSADGGITWETLPTPNNHHFTDIYLLSNNELWLCTTDNVAYYSANGGQSWAVLDIGSAGFGNFSAIAATSSGSAWVAGSGGYIEYFAGPPPSPLNRPPNAAFEFVADGLTVQFTDTSTDPDGLIVAWSWDFGDSTGSNEQHPTHTFPGADTYFVRLTVYDDDGDSTSALRFVTVQPNPGGTFGEFTEVTPIDSVFVTPADEDFWVITTAPADVDNDGDLDVAVLGYYVVYNQSVEDRLLLLINEGAASPEQWNFSYVSVPLDTLTTGHSDLAWGDADNDGDMDLVVGSNMRTVIYRNDNGLLTLTNTQLPGYLEENSQADFDLQSISWADYDNDGDLDLLIPSAFVADTSDYHTKLMRNDGANGSGGWIFTETDSVFAPTTHAQSIWADYDNDQDLDLLLVNLAPLTDKSFIRRYRNDGNGQFVGEDILGILRIEHGEAGWGDYDADGDFDILIAGNIRDHDSTFTQTLRIYQNNNDVYTPLDLITCTTCEGWLDLTAATWADYDTDGDIDILLAGSYNSGSQIEGRARVYDNENGTFVDSGNELPAPRASGTRGGTFSWFDLDGDGDLDYFIAGQYFVPGGNGLVEAQMHVYRNDAPGQNAAPTSPGSMTATVQPDGSVALSWLAASDDHTPSAALTYDLSVFLNGAPGTLPKRLPKPGNVSNVTQWLLNELPNGHYEWALQAVDAAYNGSPVAMGSFSVGVTGIGNPDNLPLIYRIEQNYPNPFNPSTQIRYELPKASDVELTIFNVLGQSVRTLVSKNMPAGIHTVLWDGRNDSGRALPSGTYFYRIKAAEFTGVKKMLFLK
jgi:photosystem II stability/assembly factor-like uncharacterized protein